MTMTPLTVLCVDDDPDLLAVLVRVLRKDGYDVVAVPTPHEALAVLASRPVAVMVSDYEMPEMDGVELSVRARALSPETTRVMVTGRRTVDTALAGINIGEVFRFLHKPFEPDALRREVAAAVAHHLSAAEVVAQRTTALRRQRLLAALEADHPGIAVVARDDDGAYLLDGDARHWALPSLAPLAALWPARR
jgi:DNA-binding NtrC family response regulator